MSLPSIRLLRGWRFSAVGWLSALIYLVVAGGVPLPMPVRMVKDTSIPFPCMDRSCGCQSAGQCWNSCCCHTKAQRIAWARDHGIAPPAAFLAAVNAPTSGPAVTNCCTKIHDRCGSPAEAQHNSQALAERGGTDRNLAVVGLRALSCHGFDTNWLASVIALPPDVVGRTDQPLLADVLWPIGSTFSSPAYPPPIPPPRRSFT